MKGHKKHSTLVKPNQGDFHRNEWSIIGAPCPRILTIASQLNDKLKNKYNVAYLDDDHNAEDAEAMPFGMALQNRIKYFSYFFKTAPNRFNYRQLLNDSDAVLLNGNHYTANQQIVIINAKKKESLSKKLDRLTNVSFVILDKGEREIYDFLQPILSKTKVPVYSIEDLDSITDHLSNALAQQIAPLTGLVLAGGKSMRMGTDKTSLQYHETDQLTHTADLLSTVCDQVYISAANKAQLPHSTLPIIEDSFTGLGPFGGIVSAFRYNPNTAFFTLPCDVPLVDQGMLQELIDQRDPGQLATCFHNPATKFPEPLMTIWEPRAYPVLLQFLAQGFSCPRKVLINSQVKEVTAKHPEKMMNVNTPEERETVLKKLG